MRHLKRWMASLCVLTLLISALPGAAALEYESKCPDCGVTMLSTLVQPTCIDNGYIQTECPVCHGKGTAHGALGIYGIENNGRAYGHTYDMREGGVCSRCNDDARPPQTRPGLDIDPGYLVGEDGHTHDFKLVGNMFARKDNEGRKEWLCQTCKFKMMEDVPPLDENGMAQPGSTFRVTSSGSSGSGSGSTTTPGGTTNPGGSATNPGETTNPGGSTTNPGGSTTNPGETTNPGGSSTTDPATPEPPGMQPSVTPGTPCANGRHTWKYLTEQATCTKEGRYYRSCSACGAEESIRTLPKSDHGWKYETIPATCTAEGKATRSCPDCGAEETLRTIPMLAHSWENKIIPATTSSAGRIYRVCSVCGGEETLSDIPRKLHDGSGSTEMPKLSQSEITQLLKNAPSRGSSIYDKEYDVEPSYKAPYAIGKVTDSLLQEAAARLNAMRRIAGLPSVTLDAGMCESAQYGAVVNAALNELTHYPSQPAGMDKGFYQKGRAAASSSNIACGYSLVGSVDGYMEDSDAGNISQVGHRTWQLNPKMGKVGFGMAGVYSMEMAHDQSGQGCNYDYIAWPASGSFPSDIFGKDYAWSVHLNPSVYAAPAVSSLAITLTGDGKTWTFQGSERYTAAHSGKYFNCINGYGGVGYGLIFRPDGISVYDGTYSVRIDGLKLRDGTPTSLNFQVDFFNTGLEDTGIPQDQQTNQIPQLPDSVASGNPFTDVPESAYYKDAVLWALGNNVTTGVTETQFQPNSTCTRGQVVTFLWRAKGCPEPRTQSNPFTDVKSSSPFYKAILWAQENGITTGTTATTFNPGGTCTNGHVLTFLWRANGQPAAGGSSSLASRYPNQYFTGAIGWAQARGILSSDSMNPRSQCPRADIVTYLYRDASNS